MLEAIEQEITEDTNNTNLKLGTLAQSPTTTTSCLTILVLPNIFFNPLTGFRRLICTSQTYATSFFVGYSST